MVFLPDFHQAIGFLGTGTVYEPLSGAAGRNCCQYPLTAVPEYPCRRPEQVGIKCAGALDAPVFALLPSHITYPFQMFIISLAGLAWDYGSAARDLPKMMKMDAKRT